MQVQRVFLLSIVCLLSIQPALLIGVDRCSSSQQQCVEFERCPKYSPYFNRPASGWPQQIQHEVRNLLCKTETRGQKRIYFICCNIRHVNKPSGIDLLDFNSCGKDANEKIAYGTTAKVFQFPWMALLFDYYGEVRCGGTLIAAKYVLTAAHCDRPPIAKVRLGENDLNKPIDCNVFLGEQDCADPPQDIAVDEFIKHSMHSVSKRKNDIALIRLSRPAILSDSVKTICLPIKPEFQIPDPKRMIVSGWGSTEHGLMSQVLQYAVLPVVDRPRCLRMLTPLDETITLDDSQVCAGGKDKMDNCSGDSGGPLQTFNNRSVYIQYGIVSYGIKSCGMDSVPGVYTKVSYYADWILQNLR